MMTLKILFNLRIKFSKIFKSPMYNVYYVIFNTGGFNDIPYYLIACFVVFCSTCAYNLGKKLLIKCTYICSDHLLYHKGCCEYNLIEKGLISL